MIAADDNSNEIYKTPSPITDNQPSKSYGVYKTKTMSDLSYDKKSASAFKTIGEVAAILDVEQHVLRFWETKFSYIKPMKRGGGRRYYRPDDIELLQAIHKLLYKDGYTIKGVQKLFKDKGKKYVLDQVREPEMVQEAANHVSQPQAPQAQSAIGGLSSSQRDVLRAVLKDLKTMRDMLGTS